MQWPGGYNGEDDQWPGCLNGSLVSTLSPTVVNELRIGYKNDGAEPVGAVLRRKERPRRRPREPGKEPLGTAAHDTTGFRIIQ